MPRTPTLALLSPPLDSDRRPGTERRISVALAAVLVTRPSPSRVDSETLERILVVLMAEPVTTMRSSCRPSVLSAGASAVWAWAAPMDSRASDTANESLCASGR